MDTQATTRQAATPVTTLLPVATFWAGGPLSALDKACIASFAQQGHETTLFSYDELTDLPPGVRLGNAADIAPQESLAAFIYDSRPNLSHFSDYFRYRLFSRTDQAWIDADLLAIKPVPSPREGYIFARETKSSLCGAIMRIGGSDPKLQELIRRTETLMNKELAWGATGPRLLTSVFGPEEVFAHAAPPQQYFPIHYDDFFLPFLPETADECAILCNDALTLHLWNNLVVAMGYWKEIAPPEGSYLWSALRRLDLLSLFRETYPTDVMRAMVTNWRLRKSGADIGILKLARQVAPSVVRTIRPRLRALLQSQMR